MNRTPIHCSNCQMPLSGGLDTFGPDDFPLCWYCHSRYLQDDDYDFYAEKERVLRLQQQYADACPYCHTPMEIGVADWSIGKTCPDCGFHSVILLEPGIMI